MLSEDDSRLAGLEEELRARLDEPAREWLRGALADAATRDTSPLPAWERHFASAGRRCGGGGGAGGERGAVPPSAPAETETGPGPGPADPADAARVLLLHAARVDTPTLTRLYTRGTAAERRAVLLALEVLDPGPDALALVEDALRTNDTRLIAAALRGAYADRHLPPHAWRQAVLKCLFTGVPVGVVAGLSRRAAGDAELARMLADYAAERTAAGRPVPDDLTRVLALTAKEQS